MECRGDCVFFCPFKRANAHILKAHAAREDPGKLRKLATRGNVMGRAYAATLLLNHDEKLGHVAQARLPTGTVPYVYRGTVPPFSLLAMQHGDDPALRLLGAAKFIKSRKLHVYSTPDRLITTHKRAAAPPEFVAAETERLDLLDQGAGLYTCEHPEAPEALVVEWVSAKARLRICSECAAEKNTVHRILEHYAGPEATRDFRPGLADGSAPEAADVTAYLKGAFGDAEFLARAANARLRALRAGSGRALVIAGKTYDTDDAFIAALNPSPQERAALKGALRDHDRPLVLEKASAVQALAALWPTQGLNALAALTGDRDLAAKLYTPTESAGALTDLLARAAAAGDRARIDRELPRYGKLPGAVAFADDLARHYRARGRDETLRLLTNHQSPDTKERSVALALLTALNASEGRAWKYSPLEADLAGYLQEPVKTLLHGAPAAYGDALQDLARRTGNPDTLPTQGSP